MDNQKNTAEVILTPEAIKMAESSKNANFTVNNIIAGIFAFLLFIMLFFPMGFYRSGLQITDIFSLPMVIFGIVGAGSFGSRMYKLTKKSGAATRILGIVIGIVGGVFIALIAFVAAIIGYFRGHPISS